MIVAQSRTTCIRQARGSLHVTTRSLVACPSRGRALTRTDSVHHARCCLLTATPPLPSHSHLHNSSWSATDPFAFYCFSILLRCYKIPSSGLQSPPCFPAVPVLREAPQCPERSPPVLGGLGRRVASTREHQTWATSVGQRGEWTGPPPRAWSSHNGRWGASRIHVRERETPVTFRLLLLSHQIFLGP